MRALRWMLIVVLAGSPARGDGPPAVVLRTVDCDCIDGQLVGLECGPKPSDHTGETPVPHRFWDRLSSADAGMAVQTRGGERVVVPLSDLIEARLVGAVGQDESAPPRVAASAPASSTEGWPRVFATRDGQRLVGRCAAGGERGVTVHHLGLGELVVPRDKLAWIGPGESEDGRPRLLACGEKASSGVRTPDNAGSAQAHSLSLHDEVLLANGDVARGSVVALGPDRVRVDADGDEVDIPWSRLTRVSFASRPVSAEPPPPVRSSGLQAVLDLTDGSRLLAEGLQCVDGAFRWSVSGGVEAGGRELAVPADGVAKISVQGGRWHWLSDLQPVEIDSRALFGPDRPPLCDRNVLGGPIALNGVQYDRGIGVHASCSLRYALDGGYEHFVSRIGLDDDSGDWANVDVQVVVDGQVRFSASAVRRREVRPPVRVSLTGARRLELIVAAGANGDVQDRFDWADAGLVRAPPAPAVTQPPTGP